jgi:VanZ family protein
MAETHQRFRVLPFVIASAVSSALVLAAPFIGEIRRALLLRFPGQFVRIIGGIVLLAVVTAIVAALARIRDRRAPRYAALAVSLIVAAVYTYATRTPDPQVNAVERFHFVEYGLITWLFYRAWRPAGDLSAVVLPVLAGLIVGTIEEWFQWFIPARVGDVRDIFLNGVAIGCGLIFSIALEPLDGFRFALTPEGRRRIGAIAALTVLVFAGFFVSVHVGYAIQGDGWSFRSCFTSTRLEELAADRTARWRGTFFERPKRLSAEDQYMTEGLWHVQRRNTAWTAEDFRGAWGENQILERYFAPVLDTPSYVSKTGHRWGAEHRADAERRASASSALTAYESIAHPSDIHVWPKGLYWTGVAILVLLLALPWLRHRLARHT